MEIKIFWTDFAKAAVRAIYDYHVQHASRKVAIKLVTGIVAETTQLIQHPFIGSFEPLLANDERNFRYLIHKSYKIIYWHNKKREVIEIIDVFDCRQNPIKIKKGTL